MKESGLDVAGMLPAAHIPLSSYGKSLHLYIQTDDQATYLSNTRIRMVHAEIHVLNPSDDMAKHEAHRKKQIDVRHRSAQTLQEQARGTRLKKDGMKIKSRSIHTTVPPAPVRPESSLAGQNIDPWAGGTRLECTARPWWIR